MPEYLPIQYNPLLLADEGYMETEELLFLMTAEVESVYGQAYVELLRKAQEHLKWFVVADEAKRKLFNSGKITKSDYQAWRRNQMMTGRHNHAMTQNMADVLTAKNEVAASILNGYMPEAYAINGNWTTYQIEHHFGINTMFELVDEQTVERLLREKPDLLPKASVNIPKDLRWNKEKLNAAIVQGILQGETVEEIAVRLAEVTDMNKKAALRNAKTMTTSAQNGGRMDAYKRAQAMGVKGLKHQWLATLDGLTRYSHRQLDGDVVDVGKKFKNGLLYPGDPQGRPEEVYNCRCADVVSFEDDLFYKDEGRDQHIYEPNSKVRNMTYDQWKSAKGGEPLFKAERNASRDIKMHEEYVSLLGKKVPSRFKDFQELKYGDPAAWKATVSAARKARNARRRNNA
jgi:hypothetical protein